MRIAGVDEAGKGPVIGPMIVCGVSMEDGERLNGMGLKDSKKITPNKREELAKEIKKDSQIHIIKITPQQLDELMEEKTINHILSDCCVEIIGELDAEICYVDSSDVNAERLQDLLESRTGKRVKAAHKADDLYPIVSAASIMAKVEREKEIEKLKQDAGNFGSGYASDDKTIKFLRDYFQQHRKYPPFVRKKWKTLNRIQQQFLEDFM
ncbi:MAG: ribonuclease HII [Archaeoglobaceae archaeon]